MMIKKENNLSFAYRQAIEIKPWFALSMALTDKHLLTQTFCF